MVSMVYFIENDYFFMDVSTRNPLRPCLESMNLFFALNESHLVTEIPYCALNATILVLNVNISNLENTFFLGIWHTKCIVNVQTQSEPFKTFKVYPPVFDAFLPIHLEKYSMTIKIPQELEIKAIKPTFYFFSLNFKFKALIWQKLKIRGLRFFMNWHIEDYLQTLDEIIIQLLRNSTHSKLLTLLPFCF